MGTLTQCGNQRRRARCPFHHTYDGLGRLIKAQRPWSQPSPTETRVRTEHFYYDGVRRIQEVFTDPSYLGQIVVMTAPMIGNYGVNPEDLESGKPQVAGVVLTLPLTALGCPTWKVFDA